MELNELRLELDQIDREMVSLFEKRMRVCEDVARWKLENGRPILDASREKEKLQAVAGQ